MRSLPRSTADASEDVISAILDTVRKLMGMDVAYISETCNDTLKFIRVSGQDKMQIVKPNTMVRFADTPCGQIMNGTLPPMMTDLNDYPSTKTLRFIQTAHIRAMISVPIRRRDGSIHGMFCCFSHAAQPALTARDLQTVTLFADLAAKSLADEIDLVSARSFAVNQIKQVIKRSAIDIHLQPIATLNSQRPVGVEALSRFTLTSCADPMIWFDLATEADMLVRLELAAIRKALTYLNELPPRLYLTLNASPETIAAPEFLDVMMGLPRRRVVIELTEHKMIGDVDRILKVIAPMRSREIGIAIDDLGAGYAGLSTVVELNPNVLKLDRSLVSDIHNDPVKQSLTRAMVYFSKQIGAFLIAEGIEKEEEKRVLLHLGVRFGQGYHLGRPIPAEEQITRLHLLHQARSGANVSESPEPARWAIH